MEGFNRSPPKHITEASSYGEQSKIAFNRKRREERSGWSGHFERISQGVSVGQLERPKETELPFRLPHPDWRCPGTCLLDLLHQQLLVQFGWKRDGTISIFYARAFIKFPVGVPAMHLSANARQNKDGRVGSLIVSGSGLGKCLFAFQQKSRATISHSFRTFPSRLIVSP